MADSTLNPPGAAFGRIAAAVPVSDISRALAFYQDILEMSVTFTNGDPVGFVILERDAAELHLTLVKGHQGRTHNVAHLMVDDAAGLHDHLVSHGVRIIKGLRDADYGLRGFVFADPDGNRIDVGQQLHVRLCCTPRCAPLLMQNKTEHCYSRARDFRCPSHEMPETTLDGHQAVRLVMPA
jgi:catechol 2,3-dioxygenase-like lactoylglutathione lyase family enzyme